MDREYAANSDSLDPQQPYGIGKMDESGSDPKFEINELGQTVTEGRQFGTFIESMGAAIRAGAGTIELATQLWGSDKAVGAEAYGVEARRELREMAKANEVKISGVHTPTQVGNLSGFTGPERGFSDEQRKVFVDEVKKAVNFLADISPIGGAVVVHTGEYQRPISDQPWARDPTTGKFLFKGYEEEPERAVIPLVDDRTGQVLTVVRKSQVIARAVWNRYDGQTPYYDGNRHMVQPNDYIDYEGNWIEREKRMPKYDPATERFVVKRQTWKDFEAEAIEINQEEERKLGRQLRADELVTPAEAFLRATTETQEKIAEGWAGIYGRDLNDLFENIEKLKKLLPVWEKIEAQIPPDERFMLEKEYGGQLGDLRQYGIIPSEKKMPTELIKDRLHDFQKNLLNYREAVVGQTQSAEEQRILREHATDASKYAKKQSIKSYAEAAIYAFDQTREKHLEKPVFVAPENLWPEMGWGTHPEELRDLIMSTRTRMVEILVKERGVHFEDAKKAAEQHIKATLDFQHLGMWWKHFEPAYSGEPEAEKKKRFDQWFLTEIKKLADDNLIGNLHIVDGMGGSHHHLPPGQGVFPIKTALDYLKEKGYTGSWASEAWEEGPARQLTKYWEYMNAFVRPVGYVGPVAPGQPNRWSDVFQSYFGRAYPPNYIFGAYAPSQDWSLWSQVPME